MNEQRFALSEYSTIYRYSVIDNIQKGTLKANEIIILLNRMSNEIDEQQATIIKQDEEIKRLEKMIWKIQWRFQQEVGIEKAKEHYQEIDKEMED